MPLSSLTALLTWLLCSNKNNNTNAYSLFAPVMMFGCSRFKICFTIKGLMPGMCLLSTFSPQFFSLSLKSALGLYFIYYNILVSLLKCDRVIWLCGLQEVPDTSFLRLFFQISFNFSTTEIYIITLSLFFFWQRSLGSQ